MQSRTEIDRRLINAIAARVAGNGGPQCWVVRGKYAAGECVRVLQSGLTFREARATAASIRAAGQWANAERA